MMEDSSPSPLSQFNSNSDEFWTYEVDVHIQKYLDDDLVKEALKKGVDLRHYSKEIEKSLLDVENESIRDYIEEGENIVNLHDQMSACDAVLERMEQMLNGFQSDLSSISSEIQSLQDQSIAMNVKLKNRQAIRGELSQYVDEMVIPEAMIHHILETPVTDDHFREQLHELNHKIAFVREQAFRDARSCADVKDILNKLKFKALAKIREFLLQKIYSFRKPMANYQIPQSTLLKFRIFNEFLMANERHVAKEVRDGYVETMSKVYYSYFKSYFSRLLKLQYSFEVLFRSLHFALMDNCCREYLFICDFFLVSGTGAQTLFDAIMGKTLSLFLKQMEQYTSDCFDAIAVFLSVHIVLRYRSIVAKRAVPALDRYWEALLNTLWPCFENILRLNIHSVHSCQPHKMGSIDCRPHYITRRYAEFSAAVLGIDQSFPTDRVKKVIGQLQEGVDDFLLRMAGQFQRRRDQLIFLINNYDLMLTVYEEHVSEDAAEAAMLRDLLKSHTQEFVEDILSAYFSALVAFVKECESGSHDGTGSATSQQEGRVQHIVSFFNSHWKQALEDINHRVMTVFSNFKNGTQILQATVAQLIHYYHRFQKVICQPPFCSQQIRNELISIHNIMFEVKRYKPSF